MALRTPRLSHLPIHLLLLLGLLLPTLHGHAQVANTVDVALYPGPTANSLELRVRPNGQTISGVVSGLTLTLRWNANSGATLGNIVQNMPGNSCPVFRVALVRDPAGVQTVDGFNYITFSAFSENPLTTCPTQPGYNWPANQETVIARFSVTPGTGCARFAVVNDDYTAANNKNLYVEVNGSNVSGTPYGTPVAIANTSGGGCTDDCLGVPNGPALPGTPCDDGDPCTENDVFTAACLCRGTFNPSLCPVDIGLYRSDSNPLLLELRVRPNGRSVDSLVSGLTFTLRWETASGLGLGFMDQTLGGTDFCPLLGIQLEAGEVIQDGPYSYLTYNGFGTSFLKDCLTEPGYQWPAGEFTTIGLIPFEPGTSCAELSIVNDSLTNALNRDFFVSVNGQERIGEILTPSIPIGNCIWYSRASGTATSPIWSHTPDGPAGPATFSAERSVVVQAGHTVTLNTNVAANDLVVEAGATLGMGTGRRLSAHGELVQVLGTVNPGTSALELLSISPMTLQLGGTVAFHDVTMVAPEGVTLLGGLDIRGTLQLTQGAFNATAGTVQLRSLSTGTGRLGPVGQQASYIGTLTMQRRIPPGVTNWRLLASPVVGMTATDWNDDFITAGFPGSDYPNFDQPVGSGILWPSVRWYDETLPGSANAGIRGIPAMDQPLSPGMGFAVWCGDALGGTSAFMVDVTGVPVIAQEALPLDMSYTDTGDPLADGWNLVGNPLPSPIAFSGVQRSSNVLEQYQVYDPVSGNNAAWNGVVGTNGANGLIQSSQAFWLKANGPDVLTTVNEASKALGNSGGFFGGTLGGDIPMVRLRIGSTLNGFKDETVVVFQEGIPQLDDRDVQQFVFNHPSAPQIGTRSAEGRALSINMHGPYVPGTFIPVSVDVAVTGTYTITASDVAGNGGLPCLVLEDLVTGQVMPLSEGATYSFSIAAQDPADVPRFRLGMAAAVTVTVQDVRCAEGNDGSMELTLPGIPADITWSTPEGIVLGTEAGATGTVEVEGLTAGTYQLRIDGPDGCLLFQGSTVIGAPDALLIQLADVQDATCANLPDARVEVVALGGTPPYAYSWTDGSTSTIYTGLPGIVGLTVTDSNGCMLASPQWLVGGGEVPQAGITAPPFALAGQSTTLTGMPYDADLHHWTFGDGNEAFGQEVSHVFALPGTYTVQLAVTAGACSDTVTVELLVDASTTVHGTQVEGAHRAWFDGQGLAVLPAQACNAPMAAELLDATGRMVWQGLVPCTGELFRLPTINLAAGVWALRLHGGAMPVVIRVPVMR